MCLHDGIFISCPDMLIILWWWFVLEIHCNTLVPN